MSGRVSVKSINDRGNRSKCLPEGDLKTCNKGENNRKQERIRHESERKRIYARRKLRKEIEYKAHKKYSRLSKAFFIFGIVLFVLSILFQKEQEPFGTFWKFIYSNKRFKLLCTSVQFFYNKHFEMVIAFELAYAQILAMAVVFYYTIMDQISEGIPHRRIMSVAFGSRTAPVMFVLFLVMVPLNIISFFAD